MYKSYLERELVTRSARWFGGKRENRDEDFREIQMASGEIVSVPEFGTKQVGIDYIARPGVYAVIENNDRQIAVIETSNGYFLPGGGIDTGESVVDALKRAAETRDSIQELVEMVKSLEDRQNPPAA